MGGTGGPLRLRHRPTGAQRMSQRRSVRHPATSRGAELLSRNVPLGAKAIHIASCNPCHNHRQQFPASACTKLTAALLVCDRLQCEAAHIWRKIFLGSRSARSVRTPRGCRRIIMAAWSTPMSPSGCRTIRFFERQRHDNLATTTTYRRLLHADCIARHKTSP
jgi:hypothetical protein